MVHTKADVKTDSFLGFLTASDKTEIETMIASKVRKLTRELKSTLTASETSLVMQLAEYKEELKKQQHVVAQLQKNQALFLNFMRETQNEWYNDNVIKKQQSGREEPRQQSQLDLLKESWT